MEERFGSRLGFILAVLGMAIGAGNIWRFPRLVGSYGGWFVVLYFIFMIIWAIPLLLAEFSLGRRFRKGVLGTFIAVGGEGSAWTGAFVLFCSSAILFYYSVVTGWALRYFFLSVSQNILTINFAENWNHFIESRYEPLFFHVLAIVLVAIVIMKGIRAGIEKFNLYLLPLLFILLIGTTAFSLSLEGAWKGVHYIFSFPAEQFHDPQMWMQALSQAAWSTGAGWGLILTYSNYMKEQENIVQNSLYTIIGDGMGSMLAALTIIPTLFAVLPSSDVAMEMLASGNQGLTFISLPSLFQTMTAGRWIAPVFFLILSLATISSMISMFEMLTKTLMDAGMSRKTATWSVAGVNLIFGIPSAISLGFFNNQDWVWGLGLMISGYFFGRLVLRWGIDSYLAEAGIPPAFKRLFVFFFRYLLPLFIVGILGFWFIQGYQSQPDSWYHPLKPFSVGTVIVQWSLVLLALRLFNKKLAQFS